VRWNARREELDASATFEKAVRIAFLRERQSRAKSMIASAMVWPRPRRDSHSASTFCVFPDPGAPDSQNPDAAISTVGTQDGRLARGGRSARRAVAYGPRRDLAMVRAQPNICRSSYPLPTRVSHGAAGDVDGVSPGPRRNNAHQPVRRPRSSIRGRRRPRFTIGGPPRVFYGKAPAMPPPSSRPCDRRSRR